MMTRGTSDKRSWVTGARLAWGQEEVFSWFSDVDIRVSACIGTSVDRTALVGTRSSGELLMPQGPGSFK